MQTEITFKKKTYKLNQCEEDIFNWVHTSQILDFTHFYDKVIFHTEAGFVAAYRDNLNNCWNI